MHGLTLEERGAYNTVLDLIYDRADNLPDDDRFVAGWCGCDVRIWRRIKRRLIGLGKLTIEGGLIRNTKATCEVTYGLSRHLSCSEAGRASGAIRQAKAKENNVFALTPVSTTVSTNQNQNQNQSKKEQKERNPPTPFEPPEWVPKASWDGWIEMRRKAKMPTTVRAMELAVERLAKFKRQGHDPAKLLDKSTINGWRDIYAGRDGETQSQSYIGSA